MPPPSGQPHNVHERSTNLGGLRQPKAKLRAKLNAQTASKLPLVLLEQQIEDLLPPERLEGDGVNARKFDERAVRRAILLRGLILVD